MGSLTELYLISNNIGDEAVSHISQMLHKKNSINYLDVYWNKIGDIGASYISYALAHCACTLTHLDLHSNNIGDKGIKSISDGIRKKFFS